METINSKTPPSLPTADMVPLERDKIALQFMANQERSDKWKLLPDSVPVQLVNHRNGMCRWPIGNPHQFEAFRFCGCACPETASYCLEHQKMACSPARPSTRLPPFGTKAA